MLCGTSTEILLSVAVVVVSFSSGVGVADFLPALVDWVFGGVFLSGVFFTEFFLLEDVLEAVALSLAVDEFPFSELLVDLGAEDAVFEVRLGFVEEAEAATDLFVRFFGEAAEACLSSTAFLFAGAIA